MPELVFIGLGLYDERDISLKGLSEARDCDVLFAEFYTARLCGTTNEKIEDIIGKRVKVLTREEVEKGYLILNAAKKKKVGFLVPGDPLAATTHIELRIRAEENGIKTRIIHGASILSASASSLGLQHYKFGRTTTVPFPDEGYFPSSPYGVIEGNLKNGLHTLVLLDIRADEGRYMTVNEGIEILLQIEKDKRKGIFTDATPVCAVARIGSPDERIWCGTIRDASTEDFGPPMHSIVIPGKLHFVEEESLVKLCGGKPNILREWCERLEIQKNNR